MKLLLVEDDESLGQTLEEQLTLRSYHVIWARTHREAAELIRSQVFDLCIFDVTLPDGNGFDLAHALRARHATPFLFLTAMSEAENRLKGFELGADEFIPKPFHLKELFLRLEHIVKDHRPSIRILQVNGRRVDLDSMKITDERGYSVQIGSRDFQLLKLLIDQAPKVVSRDEMLNQIWGEDNFPTDRTIDNSILRLRQALGDEQGELISSVRRVGYRWEGGS